MTGLEVISVNINVKGVEIKKEDKKEEKDEPKTKGKFKKIVEKILNFIKNIVAKAIGAIRKLSMKIRKYLRFYKDKRFRY